MLSRFSFTILLLPLIYTGVASSVTLEALNSLWFVVLGSIIIIMISYLVATILAYLPFFSVHKQENFTALRIAISFPNIVALPIIIFPALCEFEVFHEFGNVADNTVSLEENMATCLAESNAAIFTYFFGWSILFWSFGYRALRNSGKQQADNIVIDDPLLVAESNNIIRERGQKCRSAMSFSKRIFILSYEVIKDVITSPGFIILLLSFATACIKPLQDALFQPGGVLRVIGSTLESLTSAGATMATIVVAAALADDSNDELNTVTNHGSSESENDGAEKQHDNDNDLTGDEEVLPPVESDMENSFIIQRGDRQNSNDCFHTIIQHPTFKIQVWHVVSRLFVTPAVILGILLSLDCIVTISPIARLVLLVNSCLPGALIVVVVLKANGCTKAASIVTQTYLPSYTLSVVTIAAWASVGMMTFDGDASMCGVKK